MYCLSEVGNFWVGLPDLKEENWLQLYHGWQRAESFSGVEHFHEKTTSGYALRMNLWKFFFFMV